MKTESLSVPGQRGEAEIIDGLLSIEGLAAAEPVPYKTLGVGKSADGSPWESRPSREYAVASSWTWSWRTSPAWTTGSAVAQLNASPRLGIPRMSTPRSIVSCMAPAKSSSPLS
jgi:hypothetical protein